MSLDHRITAIRRHAVRNPRPNGSHPTQGSPRANWCIDAKQNIESVKQSRYRWMMLSIRLLHGSSETWNDLDKCYHLYSCGFSIRTEFRKVRCMRINASVLDCCFHSPKYSNMCCALLKLIWRLSRRRTVFFYSLRQPQFQLIELNYTTRMV